MPTYESLQNKDMQTITVRLKDSDAATAGNYGTFFIASRPYDVMEVRAVWSTASTSGTLQVERLTGTTAEGSGDNLLTTAIDMSGTANTVNSVDDKGMTKANRNLVAGDRLALVDGGDITSQANLVVTIVLMPSNKGGYK